VELLPTAANKSSRFGRGRNASQNKKVNLFFIPDYAATTSLTSNGAPVCGRGLKA
jgi:hypothetical protein